jgi:hypothetical protein
MDELLGLLFVAIVFLLTWLALKALEKTNSEINEFDEEPNQKNVGENIIMSYLRNSNTILTGFLKKILSKIYGLELKKVLGYLLLIPPVWSSFAFVLIIIIGNPISNDQDFLQRRVQFDDFSDNWTGTVSYHHDGGGGGAASMLPVYIGLMALAGVYLIRDAK